MVQLVAPTAYGILKYGSLSSIWAQALIRSRRRSEVVGFFMKSPITILTQFSKTALVQPKSHRSAQKHCHSTKRVSNFPNHPKIFKKSHFLTILGAFKVRPQNGGVKLKIPPCQLLRLKKVTKWKFFRVFLPYSNSPGPGDQVKPIFTEKKIFRKKF